MLRLLTAALLVSSLVLPCALRGQTLSGPEVLVAQPPGALDFQSGPQIAIDSSRNLFVAWERTAQAPLTPTNHGIYGRSFDAADSSPGEFIIADSPFNETEPSLAGSPAGKVAVVYNVDDLSNVPACTTPSAGKVFRRVYQNGVFSSGDQVNANGGGGRKGTAGMNDLGVDVVAYESNACSGLGVQQGIKMRRFDPSLSVAINGLVSELPLSADVDSAGGSAVVVADGTNSPGPCDTSAPCPMVVRRFAANGTALATVTFTQYANTGLVTTAAPAIAVRGDGGFTVVWVRLDFNTTQVLSIVGRRYDAAGQPLGAEFEVSAGVVPPNSQGFAPPAIAMNSAGEFVVGFTVEDRAYIRAYSASGVPKSAPVPVTNQDVSGISVALSDSGRGAVAYSTPDQTISYRRFSTGSTPQPCIASATRLCLNNGRFGVTATWRTQAGASGSAQAVSLTADTGYLWFFDRNNVEAVVKVLNGCGVNNRYWVFAGGLTDVSVELTVEDSHTGDVKTYRNPQGTPFQPIQDTNAFATCP
jgi:hypothetical protein